MRTLVRSFSALMAVLLLTAAPLAADEGMWTLDGSLAQLWRSRLVSEKTARSLARNPAMLTNLSKRVSRA